MNHPGLILGIDGGATKTIALLADRAGAILGRGESGGSNERALGQAAALAALDQAIDRAFAAANIAPATVAAACLGLAGAGRREEQARIEHWAAQRQLARRALVCDDAQLVLAAGIPGDQGVALICGTGSIAIARGPGERSGRAGGWGYLIGDEGSGYALGVAAARAAVQAADKRGAATALLPAILAHWELAAPSDIIGMLYGHATPRALLAELTPIVARAALDGDVVAGAILAHAGRELAALAEAAARAAAIAPPMQLAVAGGVITQVQVLRDALAAELETHGWQPQLTVVTTPALGALRLARGEARGEE